MLQLPTSQFLVWLSIRKLSGSRVYISPGSNSRSTRDNGFRPPGPCSLHQSKMCHWQLITSWFSLVMLVSPLMAIWELKKDVYVVELDWHPDAAGEIVVLTCDTAEEDGITWTSDQRGEVGAGKNLTIQVKEFRDAGPYTCHKGGKALSHLLLLLHKMEDGIWSTDILKDQKEPKSKTFLKCEATSYSGRFTCWWLTAISTDVTFSVKVSRGFSDPSGVTCGAATLSAERVRVDHREYKKYSVQCQEDSACPTAEERLPIEVVMDVIHKHKYEKYISSFYIRDIIKPDPPKNLQLKPLMNFPQVEVSWEYPDTWSTPHSYFSLRFAVQVHNKKGTPKERFLTDKTSATVSCRKNAKVYVQAQDRYYSSSWSEWASVSCN